MAAIDFAEGFLELGADGRRGWFGAGRVRRIGPKLTGIVPIFGFRSVGSEGYSVELDRRRAIQQIIGKAEAGDTVLIAGKGHEAYQEFEDTVVPFDDRVQAQEMLETLGASR